MKLGQAELLVIDEAAAIPLPLVKNLLGPYLVFMASTINGSVMELADMHTVTCNSAFVQKDSTQSFGTIMINLDFMTSDVEAILIGYVLYGCKKQCCSLSYIVS